MAQLRARQSDEFTAQRAARRRSGRVASLIVNDDAEASGHLVDHASSAELLNLLEGAYRWSVQPKQFAEVQAAVARALAAVVEVERRNGEELENAVVEMLEGVFDRGAWSKARRALGERRRLELLREMKVAFLLELRRSAPVILPVWALVAFWRLSFPTIELTVASAEKAIKRNAFRTSQG